MISRFLFFFLKYGIIGKMFIKKDENNMAKKEKEFKIPSRRQPFYKPFRVIVMRLIFRKPKIINLAGDIEDKSIILANHSAKSGPPCLDLYFPKKTCKWGAYEMFGNYKMRRAYLKDILYIKKCGAKPFKASIMATILAAFNQFVYKGMWMMPSYPDMRLTHTLRNSAMVLNENIPVMIFPENSNEGYKDVLTEFFPGFYMLSEKYYRDYGIDLPIYPVYYSIKKRIMVIGKPLYLQDYVSKGMKRDEICKVYCDAVNSLYFEYVENK